MNDSVVGKNIRALQETVEYQRKQIHDLVRAIENLNIQVAGVHSQIEATKIQVQSLVRGIGPGPTA